MSLQDHVEKYNKKDSELSISFQVIDTTTQTVQLSLKCKNAEHQLHVIQMLREQEKLMKIHTDLSYSSYFVPHKHSLV